MAKKATLLIAFGVRHATLPHHDEKSFVTTSQTAIKFDGSEQFPIKETHFFTIN